MRALSSGCMCVPGSLVHRWCRQQRWSRRLCGVRRTVGLVRAPHIVAPQVSAAAALASLDLRAVQTLCSNGFQPTFAPTACTWTEGKEERRRRLARGSSRATGAGSPLGRAQLRVGRIRVGACWSARYR